MLSRGTSNASHRPQRAKSTSSIRPRAATSSEGGMADAREAHQDAITAANLAYERASRSDTARKDATTVYNDQYLNKYVEDGPQLARRQSVRFAGPNAVPTKERSITRRDTSDYRGSHESHRHSFPARSDDSSMASTRAGFIVEPDHPDEDYIASEPSSYRKLRKAKSMFIPKKISSTISTRATRGSGQHLRRQSLQASGDFKEPIRVPDPRLKRSYSFLRGVTDSIPTNNRQYANQDAAIQLARDTYLQQLEQQRLKEQPSIFGIGRRQKVQKAFRRTVRSGSTNSYGTAILSPLSSVEPRNHTELGPKARTLSYAWKEKIKRLFKRSSTDEVILPVQHLDATHPHYGDRASTTQDSGPYLASMPEPNTELLRRVISRESSSHSETGIGSEDTRPRSPQSINSEDEETNNKSRVTSWTNSTATNTLNIPHLMERKRLSIINEDGGPHQSSIPAQRVENLSEGYANFRRPINPRGAGRLEARRIFSALQKQIDENDRKAATDDDEYCTKSSFGPQAHHQTVSIPTRKTSNSSSISYIGDNPSTHHQGCGKKVLSSAGFGLSTSSLVDEVYYQVETETSGKKTQLDDAELQENLTPQQIAEMNEANYVVPRRPLREVKSAFFPSSMRLERSNTSPFRRAMYQNNEDDDTAIRSEVIDQKSASSSHPHNGSTAESESVYSRCSSRYTQEPTGSSLSLPRSESSGRAGTAIIISKHPSEHESSAKPFFPQRYSSAKSSGDWKKFMTSQVASLENVGGSFDQLVDKNPVKRGRHRKENAQLDEEDFENRVIKVPVPMPKQPLGILQMNTIRRPHSFGGRVPLTGIHSPTQQIADKANEKGSCTPSPITPLKFSGTSASSILSKGSSNGSPGKTSHASLTSHKSHSITARMSPQHSSERTERLRRLKSSSVTALRRSPTRNENQVNMITESGPGQQNHNSDDCHTSLGIMPNEAGMNTKLVNSFLNRQREIQISEDSSAGPAFL